MFIYADRKTSDRQEKIETFPLSDYPHELQKKVTLMQHFKGYLESNMEQNKPEIVKNTKDPVLVKKWMRTKHAIIFRLSNKIVQVIFFDNTQIILHSEARAVTYVNKKNERLYFSLSTALKSSNNEMTKRLNYTKQILTHMLQSKGSKSA